MSWWCCYTARHIDDRTSWCWEDANWVNSLIICACGLTWVDDCEFKQRKARIQSPIRRQFTSSQMLPQWLAVPSIQVISMIFIRDSVEFAGGMNGRHRHLYSSVTRKPNALVRIECVSMSVGHCECSCVVFNTAVIAEIRRDNFHNETKFSLAIRWFINSLQLLKHNTTRPDR